MDGGVLRSGGVIDDDQGIAGGEEGAFGIVIVGRIRDGAGFSGSSPKGIHEQAGIGGSNLKAAPIDAASPAEVVDGESRGAVLRDKDLCTAVGEVNAGVRVDDTAGGHPIRRGRSDLIRPASVTDAFAGIFVHAKDMRHAEEGIVSGGGGWLIHAKEDAAAPDPSGESGEDRFVIPVIAAAPCAAGASCIDDDIDIRENTTADIIETDELHIERET